MRRNCNLELRLVPPSVSLQSSDFDEHHRQPQPMMNFLGESPNQQQQQQLTIFYNGNISVCDVTELQARNIIWLASREMEEKSKTPSGSQPSSPLLQSPVYSPATGLSMKKSLERFLQKRKYRIQATSPYH
ncbi:unnamed protein product [Ilex paraguariensis]|uniref:Protein TIFY n=1 Tax=Ilex paraguariensis TaxID=185542 RepID=A0ABC8T4H0_9AQUA